MLVIKCCYKSLHLTFVQLSLDKVSLLNQSYKRNQEVLPIKPETTFSTEQNILCYNHKNRLFRRKINVNINFFSLLAGQMDDIKYEYVVTSIIYILNTAQYG